MSSLIIRKKLCCRLHYPSGKHPSVQNECSPILPPSQGLWSSRTSPTWGERGSRLQSNEHRDWQLLSGRGWVALRQLLFFLSQNDHLALFEVAVSRISTQYMYEIRSTWHAATWGRFSNAPSCSGLLGRGIACRRRLKRRSCRYLKTIRIIQGDIS